MLEKHILGYGLKNTAQWRKNTQFRWICLFTLNSTQKIYIPSDNQEKVSKLHTHFTLEVKMEEVLTDLNWK